MSYLPMLLCISGFMNVMLLVRLVQRTRALWSALELLDEANGALSLVTRHLVGLSKRHTQLRAELREVHGIVDEQDRTLQVQRMLLSRIRGAACPCERGRR